jgi:hypothetical protein
MSLENALVNLLLDSVVSLWQWKSPQEFAVDFQIQAATLRVF